MASRGPLRPSVPPTTARSSAARPVRVLRRQRRLPDSRAVLGALLVATSVVGIYAAYTATTGGPDAAYVVAARAIRAGDPLAAGDLTRTPRRPPAAFARRAFTDPAALVGATALRPLEPGELVQAGQVIRKQGGARTSELSFPIEASRIGASVAIGRPGRRRRDVWHRHRRVLTGHRPATCKCVSVVRARGTLGGESSVGRPHRCTTRGRRYPRSGPRDPSGRAQHHPHDRGSSAAAASPPPTDPSPAAPLSPVP